MPSYYEVIYGAPYICELKLAFPHTGKPKISALLGLL